MVREPMPGKRETQSGLQGSLASQESNRIRISRVRPKKELVSLTQAHRLCVLGKA